MQFCDDCGSLLSPETDRDRCESCAPEAYSDDEGEKAASTDGGSQNDEAAPTTDLERLSTTSSGAVKKRDAVRWMESLDEPTPRELKSAIEPKPEGFEGSTYPTEISNVRITGDPEFVETIAGLLQPFLDMESHRTRLEINLQETEDRDSGEVTGNYALYLSVAERGG